MAKNFALRAKNQEKRKARASGSNFQRGSGVYTCSDCGKLTRDTGNGEGDANLCARCFEIASCENALSDGKYTLEQATEHMNLWDKNHNTPDATRLLPW